MGYFGKKNNETYKEYLDRAVNSISPSFCGAKWYNATIWLGNGMTTSCHHPPAHKIPLDELEKSYKAIHNTQYKKFVRREMLEGNQPKECEYCWKIENLGKDKISDRVHKSVIYKDEDLLKCKTEHGYDKDVDLKTLEISFDPFCNCGCSYCNASFSTVWQKDIKNNGPYQNLVSDGAAAFQQDGSHALPYGQKNKDNPYIMAFWEWWKNELQYSLQELRITGGEPTMSPDFWKLMDWWKKNPNTNVDFAVNSNLQLNKVMTNKLIETSHYIKSWTLYTSCEAVGKHAEYIRDGLKWEKWLNNLKRIMNEGDVQSVNCMLTINALCLFSLPEFLDEMLRLKQKNPNNSPACSFNILRFPSFQSVVTLPKHIRMERAKVLEQWLDRNYNNGENGFMEWEKDGVYRLISYLREVEEGHQYTSSIESRERDFKSFYKQYDQRRGKDFIKTFPMLKDWWGNIPETILDDKQNLVDGDESKSNRYIKETIDKAKKEGWILNPQESNPGSKDYIEPNKKNK